MVVEHEMDWNVEARFPASCGELVQGCVGTDEFLCSYAVHLYSYCRIGEQSEQGKDWLRQLYQKHRKVYRLVTRLFQEKQVSVSQQQNMYMQLTSEIPIGKGMGSSTADLMATLLALNEYFNWEMDEAEFIKWCTFVEPTDSIVYPFLSLVNPITGQQLAMMEVELSTWQDWRVLCLVPEQSCDTLVERDRAYYQLRAEYERSYIDLYEKTKRLFAQPYVASENLFDLAFQSAQLNQQFLIKPMWEQLAKLRRVDGVLGMNVAHSGTLIAIIYDKRFITKETLHQYVREVDTTQYYSQQFDLKIISSQTKQDDWRVKKWK